MRDYLFVINCRLRKKRKTVPKLPFLTIKPPFLGPFFQKKNAKLSHASAQNSCVSRLFDTDRCSFVRGKLPYFLPCAAHMKIRESSTLKFITKNFSAKHHNNFSAQRSNFRCKPAKCALRIAHCALKSQEWQNSQLKNSQLTAQNPKLTTQKPKNSQLKNPKTHNSKTQNPKTHNPKTHNPKTHNPKTQKLKTQNSKLSIILTLPPSPPPFYLC